MTWGAAGAGKSGIYLVTIQEALRATASTPTTELDLRKATAKIALHNDTGMTAGVAPLNWSAASPNWVNTGEMSGTGWAATGPTLTTATGGGATFTEGTTGSLRYDMADVSMAGTTLSTVHGCIIYLDAITAPATLVDAMIVAVCFGTDFATVNGTFGIQWAATGVFEIDLTP
jgi:hypothetical protein